MKRKILFWLTGSLLVASVFPVLADSGQRCAAQCSSECSANGSEKDDQLYVDCLNSCMEGCFEEPVDVPDVPRAGSHFVNEI